MSPLITISSTKYRNKNPHQHSSKRTTYSGETPVGAIISDYSPKIDLIITHPHTQSPGDANCVTTILPPMSKEQSFKRMTINGEKPFQCAICEKQFRQLSTLTNHFKIHTGEKPFKCSICNKKFRQSSTLTNHAKIHTGEKPFTCNYCLKQFRQLSTLTNHQKIHTGEKPFECVVCKKQFRQSSTLNNHIKIHVGDKPFLQEIEEMHKQTLEKQMMEQRDLVSHIEHLVPMKVEPENTSNT